MTIKNFMHRLTAIIIYLAITAYGCADLPDGSQHRQPKEISKAVLDIQEEIEIEPPRTAEPPAPDKALEKGSKIIRRGDMGIEVENLEASKNYMDTLLSDLGGYYENEQYNAYGNSKTYNLSIRIPSTNFSTLMEQLENGQGKVVNKNISASDVTEEYVDLGIRLENNLAYLQQYKALLKKTKSIKEILEIKEKIRRIEEEIESRKGRMRYIDDKVAYSTLHLNLTEYTKQTDSNKPGFFNKISSAFKNGIIGFLNFLVALVNIWPFLLLLVIILLSRKKLYALFRRGK